MLRSTVIIDNALHGHNHQNHDLDLLINPAHSDVHFQKVKIETLNIIATWS